MYCDCKPLFGFSCYTRCGTLCLLYLNQQLPSASQACLVRVSSVSSAVSSASFVRLCPPTPPVRGPSCFMPNLAPKFVIMSGPATTPTGDQNGVFLKKLVSSQLILQLQSAWSRLTAASLTEHLQCLLLYLSFCLSFFLSFSKVEQGILLSFILCSRC